MIQCQSCARRFDERDAFERHKDAHRKCLTADEMRERGMVLLPAGVWMVRRQSFILGAER